MFSTRRINSIVQGFFYYFYGRISTSVQVDYNGISTLENVFNLKNIYLCASVFQIFIEEYLPLCKFWCFLHLKMLSTWRIYTSVWGILNFFCARVFYTWKYLYQKNIHFSLSGCFSIKHIYPCASWLKFCFLH